ncbi:MAG: OmpA family protein [Weeksellaceae bacterium]|nr:OmpA family protein [Weeksellaceae bacterium]
MRKALLVLGVLAMVSCKYKESGNKGVIPLEDGPTVHGNYSQSPHSPGGDTVATTGTAAGELDSRGNFVYNVGNTTTIQLPDGTSMQVGERSTENTLYRFLSDTQRQVSDDKTQDWITLDRVYFDTGSDRLTSDSEAQVRNITAILNAYPEAEAKLGGYTDNVGSQEVNQPLSQARANSVMNRIASQGIAATRLTAEGYGQDHPVCAANDTDACKAQNRRVDIRVTRK